jgi:hypothetical protein
MSLRDPRAPRSRNSMRDPRVGGFADPVIAI